MVNTVVKNNFQLLKYKHWKYTTDKINYYFITINNNCFVLFKTFL